MTTGTGIAIAGVWVFVGLSFSSNHLNNWGKWLALLVGIGVTLGLKP